MWSLGFASAALILMSSAVCGGEFCDEGPPGKYCLGDLSGYHDCRKNPKTGKMTDTVHKCRENTRCSCFLGPACPKYLLDPCQEFKIPPKFPKRFSVIGSLKLTTCKHTKCKRDTRDDKAYLSQEDETNQKIRLDRTVLNYQLTEIWHQKPNNGKFYQYLIRRDIKSCNRSEWSFIPNLNIDTRYNYVGEEMVGDKKIEKWMWIDGGHNSRETVHSTYWDLWKNTTTGQYQPFRLLRIDRDNVRKYQFSVIATFTFKSDFSEKVFQLPDYCKTDSIDF